MLSVSMYAYFSPVLFFSLTAASKLDSVLNHVRCPSDPRGSGDEVVKGVQQQHDSLKDAGTTVTWLLQTGLELRENPAARQKLANATKQAIATEPRSAEVALQQRALGKTSSGNEGVGAPLRTLPLAATAVGVHALEQGQASDMGKATSALQVIWLVLAIVLIIAVVMIVLLMQPEEGSGLAGSRLETAGVLPRVQEKDRLPPSRTSATVLPPGAAAAGAVVKSRPAAVPPICASLILPNTEARFMVYMDSLLSISTGRLSILGTSGKPLLSASIDESLDGSRRLSLANDGVEEDPRAVIYSSSADNKAERTLAVYGRGGLSYGSLKASVMGDAVLHYQAFAVMQLEPGPAEELALTAVTQDGRVLAVAGQGLGGRRHEGSGAAYWKLHVRPGVDAVLITSCMLAVLLLLPNTARRALQARLESSPAPSIMQLSSCELLDVPRH